MKLCCTFVEDKLIKYHTCIGNNQYYSVKNYLGLVLYVLFPMLNYMLTLPIMHLYHLILKIQIRERVTINNNSESLIILTEKLIKTFIELSLPVEGNTGGGGRPL